MDMRLKSWSIYGVVLLAFALRVYQLVDHSLWFDETLSWWVATTDIPGFLLPYGAYTPLYYFLVGAVSFLGKSEFLLRFASVFFGVLAVVMIERVGRRVGGERVGLLAALLLAINPFAIWFAQDARMYAMVPFFVLVAMDGFMRATEGRGWRRMIVGSAGSYFTHTISLFIVYVQLIWWLPRFKRQIGLFRRWAAAQLIAAVPLILWEIWHFMQPMRGVAAVTWIPAPSPLAPALTLWNFVSGDTDTWTPIILIMVVLVGVVAIYGAWQTPKWRGFLLLWLLLPPVAALILSLRIQIYVDRYFAYCQFPLLIFLAAGIMAIRNMPLRTAAGAAIVVLMVVNVYRLHTDPLFAKEDWRGAAAIVNAQIQAGDRLGLQDEESLVAWQYYYHSSVSPTIIDPVKYPDAWRDLQQGAGRIWLVFRGPEVSNHRLGKPQTFDAFAVAAPPIQYWLAENCRPPSGEWRLPGLAVLLCDSH
jgi:mannosyltransferase